MATVRQETSGEDAIGAAFWSEMNDALLHVGPESKGQGSHRLPGIELNNILVPVEFSEASRTGLAFAARLAERLHSRLHLLYAVEPPGLPEWGYVHLALREAKLRAAGEEQLERLPGECGVDTGLLHSANVRTGYADVEICKAAAQQDIDLIVIASHRMSGLKRSFVGSTAERVARNAPCPVLALREGAVEGEAKPAFELRRILVTTDFSEPSKTAFPYAAALAHRFEAALILLYVVPLELGHLKTMLPVEQLTEEARRRLPEFRATELDPHLHVETHVLSGRPAHEICGLAEAQGTDLIVLSTHGYTGLKHFFLGSVAENVIRHAPCPVLVARERERART